MNSTVSQNSDDRREHEKAVFANFLTADCGCLANFGLCLCTPIERASRAVSYNDCPTPFDDAQRDLLRSEIVWLGEGSYSSADVASLNDRELASAWLETANDYVRGQL